MPVLNDRLLPDFDDMDELAIKSSQARLKANTLKNTLEEYVANCVRAAYTTQEYWPGGKSPTQSYIEKTVKVLGNTDTDAKIIKELSEQYEAAHAEYLEAHQLLENLRARISVFQTLSANQRSGM